MNKFLLVSIFLVGCGGSGIGPIPLEDAGPPSVACPGIGCAPQDTHVVPPSDDGGVQGPTIIQSFCEVQGNPDPATSSKVECSCDLGTGLCNWNWDMLGPNSQQCGSTDQTHPYVPVCPVGTQCTLVSGAVGKCACPNGAAQEANGTCECPAGTQLTSAGCQ